MFNRISSLTLAVLLFLTFFGSRNYHYILLAAVVFMILASLAINYKRLNFTWPHLLLPIIYLIGVTCVFAVIANFKVQIVFLGLASLVLYFLEMKLGHESHFLQNIFLFSVFGWYVGLFAVQLYVRLPIFFLILGVFGSTFLFAIQGFAGFSLPAKKYFYILLAMVTTETAWGLSFWPTHFLINAFVLFCIFYLIWLFAFSAFFGKLSRAKIYWQTSLVLFVLILVLLTATWHPLK
ncbi:MAG TPA: hypothetical protein VL306_02065 [Methylomirabilota bacterium]|jgi:hypothetical protein|nr:hypothetical protein [Methylomirabilota bacterium]